MTTQPYIYAILEWIESIGKVETAKQLVLPYIKSFEVNRTLDNLEVTGTLCLPRNIVYNLKRKRDAYASAPIVEGAQNGPAFFEVKEYTSITKGLQILNKKNEWVDLLKEKFQTAPGVGKVTAVKEFLISDKGKFAQCFTYRSDGNRLGQILSLTTAFTHKEYRAEWETQITKNVKNVDTEYKEIFKVGDVLTIRHGLLGSGKQKANPTPKSFQYDATPIPQIINPTPKIEPVSNVLDIGVNPPKTEEVYTDGFITERFYITNIILTQDEIQLKLEGWTWKMRQIPVRMTLDEMPVIKLLNDYIFPIILQETFIEYIVTRDACKNEAQAMSYNAQNSAVLQSKPPVFPSSSVPDDTGPFLNPDFYEYVNLTDLGKFTNDLYDNKIGNIRINITNMYDLLLTMYDKYLLNFHTVEWLGCKALYLSMGYGYKKHGNVFDTNINIVEKNVSNLDYDSYKVLVRCTSLKEAPADIKDKIKAEITQNPLTTQKEARSKVLTDSEVVYGDRALLGMIRNNSDQFNGFNLSRDSTVDRSDIINIKGLQIPKEFLQKIAKRTYVKMKYAKTLGTIKIKRTEFPTFSGFVSLYDIVLIIDYKDNYATGFYTVTSITTDISVSGGYNYEIGLGVKISSAADNAKIEEFLKLIET